MALWADVLNGMSWADAADDATAPSPAPAAPVQPRTAPPAPAPVRVSPVRALTAACGTCGRRGHKARDCTAGGGFKASAAPRAGAGSAGLDSVHPFGTRHPRFDAATAALGLLAPESALAAAPALRGNPPALASLIAATLREPDVAQLLCVVEVLGCEAAEQLLVATVAVERGGGLRTEDGSRRRSAGGVFYKCMKDVASKAQMALIFADREQARRKAAHAKRRAKS
jgi:hypothetical protein